MGAESGAPGGGWYQYAHFSVVSSITCSIYVIIDTLLRGVPSFEILGLKKEQDGYVYFSHNVSDRYPRFVAGNDRPPRVPGAASDAEHSPGCRDGDRGRGSDGRDTRGFAGVADRVLHQPAFVQHGGTRTADRGVQ